MSTCTTLILRRFFITGLIFAVAFVVLSEHLSATPIGNTVILAVTGNVAPNGNGVVSGVWAPVLNDAGMVAFLVDLTETNSATQLDQAIFRGDSLSMAEVIRTGQFASGSMGTISSLNSPALNAAGQIAFGATFDSDITKWALFLDDGQTLLEIARTGQPAPDGDGVFSGFGIQPSLNDRGEVGFLAGLTGSSNAMNNGGGVFRANSTAITQLARTGQMTPSGNGRFSNFNNGNGPALNNSGQMAFFANLSGTLNGQHDSGMFRVDNTNVVEIVREDQIPPGGDSDPVNAPRLNNVGDLAFQVFFANGGIYRADSTQLTRLAGEDEPAPDANGVFEHFGTPALNDLGQTAFLADLQGTNHGPSDDRGIFRADGNMLIQVAREGGTAPGGDGTFTSAIGSPALNAAGQVAFRASVRNTNGESQRGIFLFDDAIGLMQVAREGDALLGSAISELNFVSGNSSGHSRNGFNNIGPTSIAYQFTLLDGRQGIALWTLDGGAQLPGDYNGNGIVDAADYVVWRNGDTPDDTPTNYGVWKSNFAKSAGSGSAIVAIPEPSSLLLAVVALAAFGTRRRMPAC